MLPVAKTFERMAPHLIEAQEFARLVLPELIPYVVRHSENIWIAEPITKRQIPFEPATNQLGSFGWGVVPAFEPFLKARGDWRARLPVIWVRITKVLLMRRKLTIAVLDLQFQQRSRWTLMV